MKFSIGSQLGMSLVEVMVALAISAVLMYGVGTIYLNNQRTFQVQNNMARLQDTGRFVVDEFRRNIRIAGYPKMFDEDQSAYPFFDAVVFAGAATASPSVDSTDDAEFAGTNSDSITLMYQSGLEGGVQLYNDCQEDSPDYSAGGANYADPEGGADLTFVKNHYYIQDNDADGVNELWCATFDSTDTQMSNALLVEGVENMQVLYGVDLNEGASTASGETIERRRTADQYFTAQQVRTNGTEDDIVAVRIALLISTNGNVGGGASDAVDQEYYLLGNGPIDMSNDFQRYRVYQFVTNIRNRSEPG